MEQEKIKPLSEKAKKYIAFSFLIVFLILQYVIYQIGYKQGWHAGSEVPPLRIIEQSDEKAMATLANFMAESASGPDSLEKLLLNRGNGLSWIRDEALRDDVTWGLARELMIEGKEEHACDVVQELIERGYGNRQQLPRWASRSEQAGRILFDHGYLADSAFFFQKSSEGYASLGQTDDQLRALQLLVSSLLAQNKQDDAMTVLARMNTLSVKNPMLRSSVLAGMGRIARLQGKQDDSRKYFTEAMALWPENKPQDQNDDVGSAKISMGEALLEAGKAPQAEDLLLTGLNSLKGNPSELSFSLSAFRGLAQIAAERKDYQRALAWLYQAEGAARGHVPASDAFWSCLYDQRGWVLFNKSELKAALKDFLKVTESEAKNDASVQSNEGAGVVYIQLGEPEKAYQYLTKAASLRETLFPSDKVSLGRVYKSLGTVCDLLGKNEEALKYYDLSANCLAQGGANAKDSLLVEVLLCKSHTLCELSRWQDAADSFNQVIPMLEGEKRSETLKVQANCYDELGMRDKGDECWKEAGFPRIAPRKRR